MVLDASALLELLQNTVTGQRIGERLANPDEALHVPHLVDIEIAQALRRQVRSGAISADAGEAALQGLRMLDVERHAHSPLLPVVWRMRDNLSAYDAVYVALAEVLGTTLLTCDGRLARAPGLRVRVELL